MKSHLKSTGTDINFRLRIFDQIGKRFFYLFFEIILLGTELNMPKNHLLDSLSLTE
jgi:hypothetical protein